MTVGATATFELTCAQIIRRAYQVCGLFEASQTPVDDDLSLGRDMLNLELDALQAEGILQRTVQRTTLAVTASDNEYTLPADVIDVAVGPDNVVGTIVPTTGAETRVYLWGKQDYLTHTDKTSESTPTRVVVEKLATVNLVFWPIPSDTVTFRYSAIVLPRDTTNTSNTADAERRRQKALIWALAYDLGLAKSIPLDRLREIKGERDRLKAFAKMEDAERVHGQFYVAH